MRKSLLVLCALLLLSAAVFAQYDDKKIEFSLTGGFAMASLAATSQYADTWDYFLLDPVNESTTITMANKNSFTLGASFAYFFTPNFGVQIGGAYFGAKPAITSDWAIDWRWTTTGITYNDSGSWAATQGNLSTIPIYLNLIGKYKTGSFDIFASAGPTLYINSFDGTARSIYGGAFVWWIFEWIDWFDVALDIPKTSWTSFGFNAGGGFDLYISPSIALTVDARYFFCPKKDLFWHWGAGAYEGFNGNFNRTFTDIFFNDPSDPISAANLTTALKVNPSFFSIGGGFKFFF
jgi:opacity protein-like surface antigen